ncbi:MAG: tetratricopeptide repeat protein [Chitinispirillaceae bacterium]|nr:tetratricopeptide repeat protein [Chitinispirillaceae bacterium]
MELRSGFYISAFLAVGFAACAASADPMLDKLMADKKYSEALDYADDKLPAVQRDATVWALLAQANEATGMVEKALACYLVSWRMNPEDYQALYGAAKIYNTLNQPDNAITMAKKALDRNFTAEASWEYAKACIALNRSAEAKSALEKVIESDPGNAIANKELGSIYYDEKNWDKALPLLKKSYQAKPDPVLALRLGKTLLGTGAADMAIMYLKDAAGIPGAALELARAYYSVANYAAAAAQYQKSSEGMTAADYYQAGLAFDMVKNQGDAALSYEKAVQLFGQDRSKEALGAREKVARSQITKKAFNPALSHLQFIAGADPRAAIVPDLYFLLSDVYLAQGNQAQAIAALEKMIAIDNKKVEAYARLADLYQKSGMAEKAKKTLEALTALAPDDPGVFLSLGQYALSAEKYVEAQTNFEKSYRLSKTAPASVGLAIAAFRQGRYSSAKDAGAAALGLDPKSKEAHDILAKVFMQEKNCREAQMHLEFMVAAEPSRLDFKESLASCYLQNGESARLADLDRTIVAMSPSAFDSRLRLARIADGQNDISGAAVLYRELAGLQPKNPDVLHRLYEIALKQNKQADAADFMARFIEVSPDAEAYRDYGDVLYTLKQLDRALVAYRSALKLNPAVKGFHKRYAEIVIAKGQQDEVISALSGVIKSGEADAGTYQTMGMIYQKKGLFPKAIDMYKQAVAADPQNFESLSALAACQSAAGALNDAIVTYEQVVMMDTGATGDLRELGDIYYRQGAMPSAMKNYRRYLDRKPSDQVIAKRLGKFAFENHDSLAVVKYLGQLTYESDDDIEYGIMYAAASAAIKQYKEAVRVLEILKGMKLKPGAQRVVFKELAKVCEKDAQEARAVQYYGAYLALPGVKDVDAACAYALLLEKTNPSLAQKTYQANILQYPSDYRSFLRLGLLLSAKPESRAKAAEVLKKSAVLAASVPAVWLELGRVYGKMGRESELVDAFRNYLKTDPQNVEANKAVGIILSRKGQLSEAILSLEITNTISPNDPDVMIPLAQCYIKSGRINEAIDLLKKAKAKRKDDADLRFQLFELYQKTNQKALAKDELIQYAASTIEAGDLPSAESTIEDILATQPDNLDALMLKAKIQVMKKQYEDAINTYKEISYIDQHHLPSMCERANVYLLQSKPQWAETYYTRTIKENPQYAPALLGLARIARLKKNQAGYKENLEKALQLDPGNEEIRQEAKQAGLLK